MPEFSNLRARRFDLIAATLAADHGARERFVILASQKSGQTRQFPGIQGCPIDFVAALSSTVRRESGLLYAA